MTLTQFIERPAIKEAFRAFAIPRRTPLALRGSLLRANSHGRYHSLIGIAFDYLARFQIARELCRTRYESVIMFGRRTSASVSSHIYAAGSGDTSGDGVLA